MRCRGVRATATCRLPRPSRPGRGALGALVAQFVDVTTRRLATMLADRTAHGGEEPQFGVHR
jgi:hypothetical protein